MVPSPLTPTRFDLVLRPTAMFVAAVVATLLTSSQAGAFEHIRVNGDGAVLYWRQREVELLSDFRLGPTIGADEALAASTLAVNAWVDPECSDLEILLTSGDRSSDAPPPLTNLYSGVPDGVNSLVWRLDWPEGAEVLALTTSVYSTSDGRIIDSDIDINGQHHSFSLSGPPGEGEHDLQNTLTHEVGHFIGLAHVDDGEATMFGVSPPMETRKRSLSSDDLAGLCWLYPSGSETPGRAVDAGVVAARRDAGGDARGVDASVHSGRADTESGCSCRASTVERRAYPQLLLLAPLLIAMRHQGIGRPRRKRTCRAGPASAGR